MDLLPFCCEGDIGNPFVGLIGGDVGEPGIRKKQHKQQKVKMHPCKQNMGLTHALPRKYTCMGS